MTSRQAVALCELCLGLLKSVLTWPKPLPLITPAWRLVLIPHHTHNPNSQSHSLLPNLSQIQTLIPNLNSLSFSRALTTLTHTAATLSPGAVAPYHAPVHLTHSPISLLATFTRAFHSSKTSFMCSPRFCIFYACFFTPLLIH